MIHEQPARVRPVLSGSNDPAKPSTNDRYRSALSQLHSAYTEPRPLVILADRWASDSSKIIQHFLEEIDDDVAFVRIDKTCTDSLEGMRAVIRATGFEPNGMSLDEMDAMFTQFLTFQRARHRRTIFVIEGSQENGGWVRDKVRHLVTLESDRKFGLMVVLFRQNDPTAKTNGHARKGDLTPVTNGKKSNAPKPLELTPIVQESGDVVGSMFVEQDLKHPHNGSTRIRMILAHNGTKLREMTMDQPRLMIGSAEDNDLCIKDKSISRYHALLVRFGDTAFVKDLNSRSGTYVNMSRIRDQMVIHQDILSIGSHSIKFIAPSAK